ncbi:MAG TPA: hypothetical protein V6D20_14095 [Candidatus Obscuribacterales bacterium]
MTVVPHHIRAVREDQEKPFHIWHFGVCLGGWQNGMDVNCMMYIMEEKLQNEMYTKHRLEPFQYLKKVVAGERDRLPEDDTPLCKATHITIFPGKEMLRGEDFRNATKGEKYPVTEVDVLRPLEDTRPGGTGRLTWDEYITFLRFFCYDTRFSVFFSELPRRKRDLTRKWVLNHGLTLDMSAGSERDWSFAYTTVRTYSKMGESNISAWCRLKDSICADDLERLVLFHTLQQGRCRGMIHGDDNDSCHIITGQALAATFDGFSYRVIFANEGPSFYDTQNIAGGKNDFFLGGGNIARSERVNKGRIWWDDEDLNLEDESKQALLRDLILSEISYCCGVRDQKLRNSREVV